MNALSDIISGISSWRIWMLIGTDDIISRYRRTILGPFWLVISQVAFIFGIWLLRKNFSNSSSTDFLLFLATSVPIWGLIGGFFIDGPTGLIRSKGHIESYPLPLSIYIIRLVVSNFVNFLHSIIVFFFLILILRPHMTFYSLMSFPGLLLILTFGFGITLMLAPLGGRYRDLGPAMSSAMSLAFILTPVFWEPTAEQLQNPMILYNPFFYLLEVTREPLLNNNIPVEHWGIAAAISIITFVAGFIVYSQKRTQVIYWL